MARDRPLWDGASCESRSVSDVLAAGSLGTRGDAGACAPAGLDGSWEDADSVESSELLATLSTNAKMNTAPAATPITALRERLALPLSEAQGPLPVAASARTDHRRPRLRAATNSSSPKSGLTGETGTDGSALGVALDCDGAGLGTGLSVAFSCDGAGVGTGLGVGCDGAGVGTGLAAVLELGARLAVALELGVGNGGGPDLTAAAGGASPNTRVAEGRSKIAMGRESPGAATAGRGPEGSDGEEPSAGERALGARGPPAVTDGLDGDGSDDRRASPLSADEASRGVPAA
jgi:hypothetical protein